MTEREFICWLRGYLSDSTVTKLSEEQVHIVKKHLNRVEPSLDILLTKTS